MGNVCQFIWEYLRNFPNSFSFLNMLFLVACIYRICFQFIVVDAAGFDRHIFELLNSEPLMFRLNFCCAGNQRRSIWGKHCWWVAENCDETAVCCSLGVDLSSFVFVAVKVLFICAELVEYSLLRICLHLELIHYFTVLLVHSQQNSYIFLEREFCTIFAFHFLFVSTTENLLIGS